MSHGGADLEVGVVEAVVDVPAQLQELLPLQQDAVEEAEGEEQLPVDDGLRAAAELRLRHQLVQTLHVGLHTLVARRGDSVRRVCLKLSNPNNCKQSMWICLCQ